MSIRFDNLNLNSQIAEVSKRIDKAMVCGAVNTQAAIDEAK